MEDNKEIWKPIPGFRDNYIASDLGRIKNLKTNVIRKPFLTKKGYYKISMRAKGMKYSHPHLVHRLVLIAFKPVDNPEEFQVNHINWNTIDNRVENLEWCIQRENARKKFITSRAYQTFLELLDQYSDIELDTLLIKLKKNRAD